MASTTLDARLNELKIRARAQVFPCLDNLPSDVAPALKQLWYDLEAKVETLLEAPQVRQPMAAVLQSNESCVTLFTALGHINDCVSATEKSSGNLQQELARAKEALSESNTQLAATSAALTAAQQTILDLQTNLQQLRHVADAYKSPATKLVLRQCGYLVTNKLVRLHMKGKDGKQLTPSEACFVNLNNLKKAKATDQAALTKYLDDHPDLEEGLDMLTNTFVEAAVLLQDFPVVDMPTCKHASMRNAPQRPVPSTLSHIVLGSLPELSERLHEDLFVSTIKG